MINPFTSGAIKTDNSGKDYPNYPRIGIRLPARILVVGGTGSGKTMWLMNWIRLVPIWRRVFIAAKMFDTDPIYQLIKRELEELEKETGMEILFYTNDLASIPPPEEIASKEGPTLVIIDDFVTEKDLKKSNVPAIWTRGRHSGITACFCSQTYFGTPAIIRQNTGVICLKKVQSVKDYNRIAAEYNLEVPPKQLAKIYRSCVGDDVTKFMLIVPGDPIQFRCGWKPMSTRHMLAV